MSQSIDFTGGRNFKVQFENKVEPEQVRELISSKFGDANVSVIAIGADGKTVRISTNYRIEEEGNNIDSEIEAYLYETLKPLLTQNITLETFIDRENHTGGSIISSQKVGPSIADDIKVSAIWSVVLALIAIGLYILLRFRNIAYSIGSVCALACDTIIILGAYSMFWGHPAVLFGNRPDVYRCYPDGYRFPQQTKGGKCSCSGRVVRYLKKKQKKKLCTKTQKTTRPGRTPKTTPQRVSGL